MRIIWHVEAIVTMVAQLWYNYGILILQSLIYLSLQVTLYVPSPFLSMYVGLLEVNGGLTYLCHSTLLPLKSTLLAALSLQVIILSVTWYLPYCSHDELYFCLYFQYAGSGDGTIGLFDIRTCSAISHLSVGSDCEVLLHRSWN